MNCPPNYVAKAYLQRVGYSYFATDSIVDNYYIVNMDPEAYLVPMAAKVSFVLL